VAGRKTQAVTDRQYQALEALWRRGPLTVRELLEELPDGTPYTTGLGLLQNMEKAGLVQAEKDGAAHRYAPVMNRAQGMQHVLRDFAARFFGGSAQRLAVGLVETGELTPGELSELQKLATAKAPKDAETPGKRKGGR
jgi:BlaI family penicillinase repressor